MNEREGRCEGFIAFRDLFMDGIAWHISRIVRMYDVQFM